MNISKKQYEEMRIERNIYEALIRLTNAVRGDEERGLSFGNGNAVAQAEAAIHEYEMNNS